MKTDLSRYLNEWYKAEPNGNLYPGPVVTLSRKVGCPAKKLAARLTERLNTIKSSGSKDHPWRWISKEILHESARELEVDSDQIQHIFDYKSRKVL
ncbi:MAG: hypothetical protein R6U78_05745, partial [Bacteroidales bacterium]